MRINNWLSTAIAVLIIINIIPAYAQISSFPLKSGIANPETEGFIYALPLNIVKVDVYITKTEEFKGKYSEQAFKLLGLKDIITKDKISFSINRVELSTLTEIDTNQFYYAQLPSKMEDDQTIMLNLTEKGLISGLYSIKENNNQIINNSNPGAPFRDLLKPVLIEKVDTIIRRVSIDTTIIEEKILKRSISEKSTEQQAREIADLIYRIEDSKYSLITGYQEVNYSKESLQFMLNNLNKMEKEYLAFFKGSVLNSSEKYTFYYTPAESSGESLSTLFRFSNNEGIVDKSDQTGDAVSIFIKPLSTYSKVRKFENQRISAKRKSKGIFYRIPENAQIDVRLGDTKLSAFTTSISQMGIVTFLPYNNISNVDFYGNGSLKSIIME